MQITGQALSRIQLVVFDLDGTLVDSKTDLALSVNAVREQMGLMSLPLEVIASYVGHGVAVLIRRSLEKCATDENVEKGLAFFLEYYREHMLDNTMLYPGVLDALGLLQARKLAVLTNKPVNFSREMLMRLGIASRFQYIYGGNSFPQKKPDPVGLFKLMQDLRVPPEQSMIVGDSDTDVLTGRNASVWTCGVTYGFGANSLEAVPPDILIGDLRELPALLDGWKQAGPGKARKGE